MGGEGLSHLCPSCQRRGREAGFDGGWSLGLYQGALLELIHRWKYNGREGIGSYLCSLLEERLPDSWRKMDCDQIVPIPLAPSRLRQRGFNQSFVLAKGLSRILQKPVEPFGLNRQEGRLSQVGLHREERLENIKGAFFVSSKKKKGLKGKKILLVDDVYTTGATLFEAARFLKKEGAASVRFITLARTP